MRNEARHTHRYSYADYLGFEGDTRWELIDGEAYAMAPAPTTRHQRIVQNLAGLLFNCFRGQPCRPFIAPTDVKLSEFDVVQPDGLVVCDRAKIGEAAIVGAPDLVIEILSPTTEARDRREKRALYERFGVPEYWIVSQSGFVEVYALDEQGRYPAPTLAGLDESFTSPRFPEFSVNVQDLFEDVPIERPVLLAPPGGHGSPTPS
jgi:Uma2 family endonuclease